MVFFVILGNDKKSFSLAAENVLKTDDQIIYTSDTLRKTWSPLLELEDTICIAGLEDFFKLEKLKAKLIVSDDLFAITDQKKEMLKNLIDEKRVVGVMDKSLPFSFFKPFFKKLRELFKENNLESQKEFDKLLVQNLNFVEKLKKIHKSVIPLRRDHFKNIKIASKYIAGMKSGGEFFDIVQRDGRVFFVLSSTATYADSAIIISHFEKLNREKNLSWDFIRKFLSLFDEKNSHAWKSLKKVQLFIMSIDCVKLKAFGYSFGGVEVMSDFKQLLSGNQLFPKEDNLKKAEFSIDMAKRKKITIISPGLKKNYRECLGENILQDIILEESGKSSEELAFEVFAMLKKEREDDFLEYDGSLFLMEIGENG